MRLLRSRLMLCMSRRNSLCDNRKLKGRREKAQCSHHIAVFENGEQTRKSIQLRTKLICVIGYSCCVARQYSHSSSASDIGSVLGPLLKPTMSPLKSVGSMTHGCVKFAKSTNLLSKGHMPSCQPQNTRETNGRTGLPSVESSQSRMPITRFSVG